MIIMFGQFLNCEAIDALIIINVTIVRIVYHPRPFVVIVASQAGSKRPSKNALSAKVRNQQTGRRTLANLKMFADGADA